MKKIFEKLILWVCHQRHTDRVAVILAENNLWLYQHHTWQMFDLGLGKEGWIHSIQWIENGLLIFHSLEIESPGTYIMYDLDPVFQQRWSLQKTISPDFIYHNKTLWMIFYFRGGLHVTPVDMDTGTALGTEYIQYHEHLIGMQNHIMTNNHTDCTIFRIENFQLVPYFYCSHSLTHIMMGDDFVLGTVQNDENTTLYKYCISRRALEWSVPFPGDINSEMGISNQYICITGYQNDYFAGFFYVFVLCLCTGQVLQTYCYYEHHVTMVPSLFIKDESKIMIPISSTMIIQDMFPAQRKLLCSLVSQSPYSIIFRWLKTRMFHFE